MNTVRNSKMCWNCEGEVHVHSFQCSHCGAELAKTNNQEQFPPPYQHSHSSQSEVSIPPPPYSVHSTASNFQITKEEWEDLSQDNFSLEEPSDQQASATVAALILLSISSVFFLFSFVLALFSQNGILSLQWSSGYWPYYLALAFIAAFYGIRYLQRT